MTTHNDVSKLHQTIVKKKENNETIGITAEAVFADLFNIEHTVSNERISEKRYLQLQPAISQFKMSNHGIEFMRHIGGKNEKIDFIVSVNGEEKTLSLKTLKNKCGKICPQGGQPTAKSWDKQYMPHLEGRAYEHHQRFDYIKKNIATYLKQMKDNLFCCDYLILIVNCDQSPSCLMIEPTSDIILPLLNEDYVFTRQDFIESEHEFSTTVKTTSGLSIGEFQFHKKSRTQVKFRFFKKFVFRF
tara:strand:- start:723 stop:1454 length:732 start_codon:yes stop_codon:yes gene_type:complete